MKQKKINPVVSEYTQRIKAHIQDLLQAKEIEIAQTGDTQEVQLFQAEVRIYNSLFKQLIQQLEAQ